MSASPQNQPDLVLFRGFPATNNYVWSPFVTKLEARLRFAGLKYRADQGSMGKAPRGKIPYIEITPTGEGKPIVLGDSGLIIQSLVDDNISKDFNATLSPVARAHDTAIRARLEDKLYFYQASSRT
ncbi:hypothetical protein EsH8_III_001496 [Colletotrichum jinshuiense]